MDLAKKGMELGKIVAAKNAAYGSSFARAGEILKVLYPEGIPIEIYEDAALTIRVLDKLSRIATDKQAFGESPWLDIAGYGLIGSARHDEQQRVWDEGVPEDAQAEYDEDVRPVRGRACDEAGDGCSPRPRSVRLQTGAGDPRKVRAGT